MEQPLVSAVIPTFKRPDQLRKAIESVNNQTYNNIELVVVDDGSDRDYARDITTETVKTDSYIICEHEVNQGISAARNTGIDVANGDYIAFLDDDDIWKEAKIEKQIESLLDNDRSVSYTWLQRVNEDGTITSESTKRDTGMVRTEIPGGGFPGPPAVCIKKDVFEDIGTFRESLEVLEDMEFGIRLADNYEYTCVPENLVVAASVSDPTREYVEKKRRATEKILQWHTPLPDRFGPSATKRLRSRLYRGVGITALKAEEYTIARRSLANSIRENPSQKQAYIYALAASGSKYTHKPLLSLKRKLLDGDHGN